MAFVATNPVEKTMKAKEIMAGFRRIAPKPVLGSPPTAAVDQSQQRRSGKRGVPDLVPAPADKRLRGAPSYPFSPYRALPWISPPDAAPASSRCLFPDEHDGDLLPKPEAPKVIVPRPARPVRTTICVDASCVTGSNSVKLPACRMRAEQLEAEIERDALPAVISGPGDRVLRANDAYKALVRQPVCPWLDCLPDDSAGASRLINGEVVLDVRRFTSTESIRASAGGTFSCKSRISWERNGTLTSVTAPCDVMRFDCGSSDHRFRRFVWRFDTTEYRRER